MDPSYFIYFSIDPKEIEDAGWYTPDNLPEIQSKATIARKLIDDYLARHPDEYVVSK